MYQIKFIALQKKKKEISLVYTEVFFSFLFVCVYICVCFLSNEDSFNPVSDQSSIFELPPRFIQADLKTPGTDIVPGVSRGNTVLLSGSYVPISLWSYFTCFPVTQQVLLSESIWGPVGANRKPGHPIHAISVLRQLRCSFILLHLARLC